MAASFDFSDASAAVILSFETFKLFSALRFIIDSRSLSANLSVPSLNLVSNASREFVARACSFVFGVELTLEGDRRIIGEAGGTV